MSSSEALRRAFAWDRHPKVRTWRQRRFDIARSAGLSKADSYWQSIPFCQQGYFDDGQFAIASCLLYLLIEAILELVNLVGVGLSYTKMVIAFPNDTVSKVDIAQHVNEHGGNPSVMTDLVLSVEQGSGVVLGKEVKMSTRAVSETAKWVRDTIAKIDEILDDVQQRRIRLTWISWMRSIIGLLMYIVITKPDLRGILNAPMRSLKVHTRLRKSKRDHLTPFSYVASASFETVKYSMSHLEGRPFASKVTLPVYADLIFIMNDRLPGWVMMIFFEVEGPGSGSLFTNYCCGLRGPSQIPSCTCTILHHWKL